MHTPGSTGTPSGLGAPVGMELGVPGLPPIRCCVLLAGGPTASPLARATGRSPLDLFVLPTDSVLGVWLDRLASIGPASMPGMEVRVLYDRHGPRPSDPPARDRIRTIIEADPRELRGPAGAVRDACAHLSANEWVLVGEAARFVAAPLEPTLRAIDWAGADAVVTANADGSPAGVYLFRRRVFDLVPAVGFTDLKEQLLDRIVKAGMRVEIARCQGVASLPLRTREEFLICAASGQGLDIRSAGDSIWRVVSPEAVVERGAVVMNSVIMPGAE